LNGQRRVGDGAPPFKAVKRLLTARRFRFPNTPLSFCMASAKLAPTTENFGALVNELLNTGTPETKLPQRCDHGVYIPERDRATGKAPYCQLCTPGGPSDQSIVLKMPNTHAHDTSRVRANRRTPQQCPECGSFVHEELSASLWACGDCGEKFKAPRRRSYHVESQE
jgi:hypothetical protein